MLPSRRDALRAATLLAALGTDPGAEVRDRGGRPFPACDGTPVRAVYTG